MHNGFVHGCQIFELCHSFELALISIFFHKVRKLKIDGEDENKTARECKPISCLREHL